MKKQEAIQARYDYIARWHDAIGRLTMPHRREAIEALNIQGGERILDLACGAGANFPGIMKRLGDDGLLVGIDYSPGMLKQAALRKDRARWRNVALQRANASHLPFQSGVFDRIICTYSLKVIPPYQESLDEVWRVLRKGGVFVVLDGKLSTGFTRFVNPLVLKMAQGPMTDIERPIELGIQKRFGKVDITEYDMGHTFIAVAQKFTMNSRKPVVGGQ